MHWEFLIPIALFVCVAAVGILRPLTKRLGDVLLQMQLDRQKGRSDEGELAQLRAQMEQLAGRLDLFEDRLDFTERLVSAGDRIPSRQLRPARVERDEEL
jgi:hypothetical protein